MPGFEAQQSYLIEHLYEVDNERLIQQKKLRLVLDLDETLIHTINVTNQGQDDFEHDRMDFDYFEESLVEEIYESQQREIHFQSFTSMSINNEGNHHDIFHLGKSKYKILLRPGVEQFLSDISKDFELYVYTHGTTKYCEKVLQFLRARMEYLGLPFNLQAIHSRKTTKRVEKNLKKMYCKRSTSIVIDDNPDAWCSEDQQSILTVTPFKGDPNDKELIYLYSYLINVHQLFFESKSSKRDVRKVLESMLNNQ